MRCPTCGKIVGDFNRHMYKVHGIKSPQMFYPKSENSEYADYIKQRQTQYLRKLASR